MPDARVGRVVDSSEDARVLSIGDGALVGDAAAGHRATGEEVCERDPSEKSAILDGLCEINGWHRDPGRRALPQATAGVLPAETTERRFGRFEFDPAVSG